MIEVHHARRARSVRVIWLLEELGHAYEVRQLAFTPEELQSPEHLAIHPLGQVPAIKDGDITMFESGAILEYLLERYGQGKLAPLPGTRERAEYLQWFHFGEANLTRFVSDIVRSRFGRAVAPGMREELGDAERNAAVLRYARERLKPVLELVDGVLRDRAFICGDEFSAADIMVSYGVVMAKITGELAAEYGNLAAYIERLKPRPGYGKAWAT
jgi:glutathione S-transferase